MIPNQNVRFIFQHRDRHAVRQCLRPEVLDEEKNAATKGLANFIVAFGLG
jgi:hypothetical protein